MSREGQTSGGVKKGGRVTTNLDLSATWTGNDGLDGFAYVLADAGGCFSQR
ncbi:hypothetical protein [Asticcacaulis sp. 201]|uniref:hypothetical protein n=1 Tax=Asticcacaulis sp. 201 TaxID=3028787 RepID=UPI0029161E6A|nr:hypothetical protein [Asticcacaulis sp. 201]MDV6331216.1 hypothetical protein [Asticcacaulis sp. 201]